MSDWLDFGSHDQEVSRVKGPRNCPRCSACGSTRQKTKWGDNGLWLDRVWGCEDPFLGHKGPQAENQNGKGDLVSCPQFLTWKWFVSVFYWHLQLCMHYHNLYGKQNDVGQVKSPWCCLNIRVTPGDFVSCTPIQKVWVEVWCEHCVVKLHKWMWCAVLKFKEGAVGIKGGLLKGVLSWWNWISAAFGSAPNLPPDPAPAATTRVPVSTSQPEGPMHPELVHSVSSNIVRNLSHPTPDTRKIARWQAHFMCFLKFSVWES